MHDFLKLFFDLLRRAGMLALAAAVFGTAVLAAAAIVYKKRGKRFPWGKAVAALLLLGYAAVLAYATLLRYTGGGVASTNFHLFRAWLEAWNACSLQGWLNVLLNVALFTPLGLLLPLLFPRMKKWYWVLLAGFLCSLAVELVQYTAKRGITDVDDLLCNTLGCVLGWCAVMTVLTVRGGFKKWARYLVCPLVFLALLGGMYAIYQLKPYGNLPQAPSFTVSTSSVTWTLDCTLDDSVTAAPVYKTETFDKASCDAFAAEFARNAGIDFPDVYYYDSTAMYADHGTGDFLYVRYFDRTYEYSVGGKEWDAADAAVDPETLREMLARYSVVIPETAEFSYDGNGKHTFAAHMLSVGGKIVDGTLCAHCKKDGLHGYDYNFVELARWADARILTQTEAYRRLCSGKMSDGAYFGYKHPAAVTVVSCELQYRVDTKGFYQPVYVFTLTADGEEFGEFLVPALA